MIRNAAMRLTGAVAGENKKPAGTNPRVCRLSGKPPSLSPLTPCEKRDFLVENGSRKPVSGTSQKMSDLAAALPYSKVMTKENSVKSTS
jgi:hypothetical protein